MKNKKLFFIIISTILVCTFFLTVLFVFKINQVKVLFKETNNLSLRTIESVNCDYKPHLYYEAQNYDIYTYCLDSIYVIDDYMMELKEYIIKDPDILNKFLKKMTYTTYLDGGTKEFKDYRTPKISNNGITIIKCNGQDDKTNDIYIGPESMYYKMNFCTRNNETYTKVMQVLDVQVKPLNEITLTLKYYDFIETVTINSHNEFQIGSSYEFEFTGKEKEVDLKSIFENSTIVEIRKVKN